MTIVLAVERRNTKRSRSRAVQSPQTFDCMSHGVPFHLSVSGEELGNLFPKLLPYATDIYSVPHVGAETFTLLPPKGKIGYRFFRGNALSLEAAEAKPVLAQFARDLMVHVANFAPNHVFLHAGVVSWQGRAVVLPGPSFAGKTTLVAALVQCGALYYSDEYAVIDSEGWVYPYARALQMRRPGEDEQCGIDVTLLGGEQGFVRLQVSKVVFTEYVQGSTWNPEPLNPGRAILEMLRHTIPVRRSPARVIQTLTGMLSLATTWHSLRGEADETAGAMLEWLTPCYR